jgi:hypothetical protein
MHTQRRCRQTVFRLLRRPCLCVLDVSFLLRPRRMLEAVAMKAERGRRTIPSTDPARVPSLAAPRCYTRARSPAPPPASPSLWVGQPQKPQKKQRTPSNSRSISTCIRRPVVQRTARGTPRAGRGRKECRPAGGSNLGTARRSLNRAPTSASPAATRCRPSGLTPAVRYVPGSIRAVTQACCVARGQPVGTHINWSASAPPPRLPARQRPRDEQPSVETIRDAGAEIGEKFVARRYHRL